MPVATALGAIVHQLAWQQRISQATMGAAIGVKQATMGKKLRGLVPITVDELMTIAGLLGEDPGDLVLRACRDSNPKPSVLVLAGVLCPWCWSVHPLDWSCPALRQIESDTEWSLAA